MKSTYNLILTLLFLLIFSCKNEKVNKNIISENIEMQNISSNISTSEVRKIEMIYDIEYYKNEITKDTSDHYQFENSSMKITDLMYISSIINVDYLIPGQLTFFGMLAKSKGICLLVVCF